jgi:hypothetical protein
MTQEQLQVAMQKQSIAREKQYPIYILATFSQGKKIPS